MVRVSLESDLESISSSEPEATVVRHRARRELTEAVPLFRKFHSAIVRKLVMKLQMLVFCSGDPVLRRGEPVPGVFFGECGHKFSIITQTVTVTVH